MARIRRRKDRDHRYLLDYTDVDGTRYKILLDTKSKPIANLWLKKVEELLSKAAVGIIEKVGRIDADVVAGRDRASKTEEAKQLTLLEFKKVNEDRCKNDLEQSDKTIELNNLAITSFVKLAGNKYLSAYTDADVRNWKRALQEKGSKTTLSMYHRQLKAAFNRAIRWKMIPSNPFAEVEIARWRKADRKAKNMDIDEVKYLLRVIDESGDIRFGRFVRCLLYTGCRRNEILQLRRIDVDLEDLVLSIWAEKVSKPLAIPINRALKRVFDGWDLPEQGFLFQTHSHRNGLKFQDKPWNKSWVSHQFKEYVKIAQLPDQYSLHSLRHTFATHLRLQGVPLDIVQKLLGHASAQTTEQNYDHSEALHFRAQVDLVDFEDNPASADI